MTSSIWPRADGHKTDEVYKNALIILTSSAHILLFYYFCSEIGFNLIPLSYIRSIDCRLMALTSHAVLSSHSANGHLKLDDVRGPHFRQ